MMNFYKKLSDRGGKLKILRASDDAYDILKMLCIKDWLKFVFHAIRSKEPAKSPPGMEKDFALWKRFTKAIGSFWSLRTSSQGSKPSICLTVLKKNRRKEIKIFFWRPGAAGNWFLCNRHPDQDSEGFAGNWRRYLHTWPAGRFPGCFKRSA